MFGMIMRHNAANFEQFGTETDLVVQNKAVTLIHDRD
jgi:hypothetical protein